MPNSRSGQYNATPIIVGDKQYAETQITSDGSLKVAITGSGTSSAVVQGPAADDAAAVGNPVLIGGKYESSINTVEDGDISSLKVDTNGRLLTISSGNVASGVTDSGNPVKVGGKYNAAGITLTDGQRGDLQLTPGGILQTVLMANGSTTSPVTASSDSADGVAVNAAATTLRTVSRLTAFSTANNWGRVYQAGTGLGLYVENGPYSYSRKTGDSQVKGSAGFLHCVTVAPSAATPAAGVITLYDSLTETGTVILAIAIPASVFTPYTIFIDAPFTTGLYCGYDGTVTNTNLLFTYR